MRQPSADTEPSRSPQADAARELIDGEGLFASLLGNPFTAPAWAPPVAPVTATATALTPDFAALLAKPWQPATEPEPVVIERVEPAPEPVPERPPVPVAARQGTRGRVLRQRTTEVNPDAEQVHGELDTLLAESIAALPEYERFGKCKICGVSKGICMKGPFWGD